MRSPLSVKEVRRDDKVSLKNSLKDRVKITSISYHVMVYFGFPRCTCLRYLDIIITLIL